MKRIINGEVYLTKSTFTNYMNLAREMGSFSIMPNSIIEVFTQNGNDAFIISNLDQEEMEFIKVEDKDFSEFVRNADFILDYDQYNELAIDEVEEIHDSIVRRYNSNVSDFQDKIRKLETDEDKNDLYDDFRPIMEPLQFQLYELLSLHRQKMLNGETPKLKEDNYEDQITKLVNDVEVVKESKIKCIIKRVLKPKKKRQ